MGTQDRARWFASEATDQTSSFDPPPEQGAAKDTTTWRKFAEPRSWAVKWDGFGLSGVGGRQVGKGQSSAAEAS